MSADRLDAQLHFLNEADRLKSINRANLVISGERVENSAEHSWHVALYALVLAQHASQHVDINRVIQMLLLHDLVEIDAGDHPIHLNFDADLIAQAERAAADRLFGLLPADQEGEMRALWDEFEAHDSADACFAKQIDTLQPIIQTLHGVNPVPEHIDIVQNNLSTGRAAPLRETWPIAYIYAKDLLAGRTPPESDFTRQMAFLTEACALKSILRGTPINDGSRPENTGEHSWHIALYVLILSEHAARPVALERVIQMLLIHDLVEIDAGDRPIHGDHDPAEQEALERQAADRIYALLPASQGQKLRALWDEFEASESDDAIFGKSIDRVQPMISNIESGGGSWIKYNVTLDQLISRVAVKVERGAPAVWAALEGRIKAWFVASTHL